MRLLELCENEDAEKGRGGSDEEHSLPGRETTREQLVRGEGGDAHADESGADVADTGEGLQQAEGGSAGSVGNGVGDECDRQTEDAADAHAGEETVDAEIKEARGERAQTGEYGIEQDRDG